MKRFVYLIECKAVHATKIGWAIDPEQRLRDLQIGNPIILSLSYIITAEPAEYVAVLEQALHRQFAEYLIHGEWFDINAEAIVSQVNKWPLVAKIRPGSGDYDIRRILPEGRALKKVLSNGHGTHPADEV